MVRTVSEHKINTKILMKKMRYCITVARFLGNPNQLASCIKWHRPVCITYFIQYKWALSKSDLALSFTKLSDPAVSVIASIIQLSGLFNNFNESCFSARFSVNSSCSSNLCSLCSLFPVDNLVESYITAGAILFTIRP